ncbi:tRNA guanosine(34) transglycosylase Tgt [Brachybacterium vulturis]|uniref:Queuine tRNA-ribosyltransferase n=1 Tax=Brachybacterium vulturis TaxID=2017484 RepID=A0A291GSE2_9MICO|nr:tRNA guanosine(34) transglycosylase Tgt [Brachybacterium vulturis]ATG53117.1 tRNA guanosine(34) transglycosylase Tgt [Brachybacterium vulturis]
MSPDPVVAPPSALAPPATGTGFEVLARHGEKARAGVITTPHGQIATPAFVPVGTKATVKAVLPESMSDLGAQALLANAYHLYLQPGHDLIDEAGGLGAFMNWPGPTFTDSGGFQVMSLGAGFKKVLSSEFSGGEKARTSSGEDDDVAEGKERLAHVDDDGVTFRSFINGDVHRFTPEISMQIQHGLGADIMFAFDELTTLMNSRGYQEQALERTRLWALRCLAEHSRLTAERSHRPYQQLWGVIQGAQHEDLRRRAARELGAMDVGGQAFDGFGIGGALEKENLGTIVGWVTDELPQERPRHLLGISEVDDLFVAIAAGADTFDCVSPSRVARNSAVYTRTGRVNLTGARYRRRFAPIDEDCDCYTCTHFTAAYVHHLFRAKEMLSSTLCTIHNERFVVRLVDRIRDSLRSGDFDALREETTGAYYGAPR